MSQHRGYAAMIANALDHQDEHTVALVENLMRDHVGTLDHLSAREFARLARQAYEDARAWDTVGAIDGYTLADYCNAVGITRPAWVISPKEHHPWPTSPHPTDPTSETKGPSPEKAP